MHRSLMLVLAVLVSNFSHAEFVGDLKLVPDGCEKNRECFLVESLIFTDGKGVVWKADAGLKTDGASIPGIFQPFVGKPYEKLFIKSAVVHDHYCKRRVRSWRQTHRMFYDGLVSQGVSIAKAKVMYYAVYVGGPKWVKLIPGKDCGHNCVNFLSEKSKGEYSWEIRDADYSSENLKSDLDYVSSELEKNDGAFSLEQLEKRAHARSKEDFFFRNGSAVYLGKQDKF